MLYYLSNADLPGREAHTIQQMNMCRAFSKKGEDVHFLHPSYGPGYVSWDEIRSFYGLGDQFDITTIRTLREPQNDSLDSIEGIFKVGRINAWLLRKLISGELSPDDTVYMRSLYPGGAFIEWCSRIPNKKRPKLVFEHHRPMNASVMTRIFKHADGVVCITKALKQYSIDHYDAITEKCFVAPDGMNLNQYEDIENKEELRHCYGLPSNEDIVMYTGHLYPRKGVSVLADAATDIQAQVYIVGGKSEDVERLKNEYGHIKNLHFTGFIDPSEIAKYQQCADVLVAPYTTEAWMPSPLKLFEYMAAGVPAVVSNLDVVREVLEDERNGLLVEPESAELLAQQVNYLLSNPDLAERISNQAREDAKQYSWTSRAGRILDFIDNLNKS